MRDFELAQPARQDSEEKHGIYSRDVDIGRVTNCPGKQSHRAVRGNLLTTTARLEVHQYLHVEVTDGFFVAAEQSRTFLPFRSIYLESWP